MCSLLMALFMCLAPQDGEVDPVQAAIDRGVEHLLQTQKNDGSWGSVQSGRPVEIMATVPGSHRAFKVATSALCVMALDAAFPEEKPEAVQAALGKGLDFLIEKGRVRRPNGMELYNVWAFGYGLECLGRLIPRIEDPEVKRKAIARAESLVKELEVYQVPDGGWGYFDFEYEAYRPAGSSMTFTTGSILVGMHEARKAGIEIPQKMIDKALKSLRRARKEDGSYIYGEYLKYRPNMSVNNVKGSISRSACCHLAQYYFGGDVTRDDLVKSLEDLLEHQHFADIGRKRPWPHEAWYGTSGYFFLFGQYYTALAWKELPEEDRKRFVQPYIDILLKLQEPDGSWWDFPFYHYHKAYGTAYALLCLSIYR